MKKSITQMASKDFNSLYDKMIRIPIHDKRGKIEDKNVNLQLTDYGDILEIKLRTNEDLFFNYTEKLDLADFEMIKNAQKLDINYNEFKQDVVEMLDQYDRNEMFLKCEIVNDKKCSLIFYCKSKIKSIVYLTLDLTITSQREIYNEMKNNFQRVYDINDRQKLQISAYQKSLQEKNQQIQTFAMQQKKLIKTFLNDVKMLDTGINSQLKQIEIAISKKIDQFHHKLRKLENTMYTLQTEIGRKKDSNGRMLQTMENLRLEATGNSNIIINLRKENRTLKELKDRDDKLLLDLNRKVQEQDKQIIELQSRNEELREDLERSSQIIAQTQQANDELGKDLLQANQMLVSFNNHYDAKAKMVEEIQNEAARKEHLIKEHTARMIELAQEFEEYKRCFNAETEMRFKNDFIAATNKVQELEEALRRSNKINALLSEKLNSNPFHT